MSVQLSVSPLGQREREQRENPTRRLALKFASGDFFAQVERLPSTRDAWPSTLLRSEGHAKTNNTRASRLEQTTKKKRNFFPLKYPNSHTGRRRNEKEKQELSTDASALSHDRLDR